MKIKWVSTEELVDLGHGAGFYHRDVYPSEQPFDRLVMAFLDGYDWLHKDKKATVFLYTYIHKGSELFSVPCQSALTSVQITSLGSDKLSKSAFSLTQSARLDFAPDSTSL
jgi:hypothetical protein